MASWDHCKRSRYGVRRPKTQKPENAIMSDSEIMCLIEEVVIN
jgi:hypothetical protein